MLGLESEDFRIKYEKILASREAELIRFFFGNNYVDLVLLCWCNPDRQKDLPKLFCHRILVGYWLEEHFPGLEIVYADGADKPVWERK